MSDFFEQKQDNLDAAADQNISEAAIDNAAEQSTVFSAPAEHNDKVSKSNKKRLTAVIAACLAVAVLIGGTIAVIKLIPEMTAEETPSSMFEDIKVIETNSKDFKTVTVTNKNGEFKFVKQQITSTNDEGENTTTDYWGIEGIDTGKLSTSTMNSMISSAAEIIATREIDTKTAAECGLDNPKIKVKVISTSADKKDYTVLVGDASPDGLGSYMMVEGIDTIYVAADSEFSSFDFALTDLADKTSIPTTMFTADTSDNKAEDGAYAYFDSLTISGKNFPETVTIVNNKVENASAELVPYLITTPIERYADATGLTPLVQLFSNEVAVVGCYAFDITDETLKEFKLDNPDVTVTMTIDGEPKSFKISKIDDEYCAVIYDGATMIRKCSLSSFGFFNYKAENLYYKNMFMHSINDVKNLSFNDSTYNISFDISSKEDENQKITYTIKSGDKTLDTDAFKSFYGELVTIQTNDFATQEISAVPDGTVTFVFNDNSKSTVEFYKANATEYQYSINGIMMGKIPSSTYNSMVKDFNNTAANK